MAQKTALETQLEQSNNELNQRTKVSNEVYDQISTLLQQKTTQSTLIETITELVRQREAMRKDIYNKDTELTATKVDLVSSKETKQ